MQMDIILQPLILSTYCASQHRRRLLHLKNLVQRVPYSSPSKMVQVAHSTGTPVSNGLNLCQWLSGPTRHQNQGVAPAESREDQDIGRFDLGLQ